MKSKILRQTGLYRAAEILLLFLQSPAVCFLLGIALLLGVNPSAAADSTIPDFSVNPEWFPKFFKPYTPMKIPPPDLRNTKTLSEMIHEGKIELSLAQLRTAVIENNLDIAVARYNNYFSQADVLRANGGQAARGVDAAGASVPISLFSAAIGAGVGSLGSLGGIGVTGSISGQQRSLNIAPRGAYDPTFLFNFSWDRTTSPLNSLVVAGVPAVIPNTTFYQFALQQAFTTGTSFSWQLSNQRQSTTQQSLIYNPDVVSRMSFNIVQQLMNGFGFEVNRRFQTVARNNRQIVRQWFRQQVNTILSQAASAYWNLVAAQEQVRSADEALKVARQLNEEDKKRLEIGTIAPLTVVSDESEVAARNRDFIVAQTNLQTQEMSLKDFFSKEVSDELGAAQIVATDPLPDPQDADIPALNEALSTALQDRPELPQAEGTIKNDEVAVKFTRNFMKPTFNVFGLFASAGLYGNQFVPNPAGGLPILRSGGLAQELTQFIHFKYPEYAVGFAVTIPIKNRSAQADAARAQLDERQAETSLKRTTNQIGLEVRNAIIGLVQAKSQVAAARESVTLNRQNLDAGQKKMAAGVSTAYDVILVERDLFAAQLGEVQARSTYAKALVEMDRSTGTTLGKNHIDLDEALQGRIAADHPASQ